MPDPPTGSPAGSPTRSSTKQSPNSDQPSSQKPKLDSDPLLDQDWEQVEKPPATTEEHELATNSKGDDLSEEGELVKASATEEHSEMALHTAEGGGNAPVSGLLRDW